MGSGWIQTGSISFRLVQTKKTGSDRVRTGLSWIKYTAGPNPNPPVDGGL